MTINYEVETPGGTLLGEYETLGEAMESAKQMMQDDPELGDLNVGTRAGKLMCSLLRRPGGIAIVFGGTRG